jgi:CTP synthase (UTP-ammonia lyase)
MVQDLNVGVIGDFDPNKLSHAPTNEALKHAADHLGLKVNIEWLPTPSLVPLAARMQFDRYDALWASPGSPYRSMEGALLAIRQARLWGKPFIGT